MVSNQKTIKAEVSLSGIGVHSGAPSKIRLKPSSIDSGISFYSSFANETIQIGKVIPEEAMHATVLKGERWFISTIEHLMAAITAFGIDNLESLWMKLLITMIGTICCYLIIIKGIR